MEEWKPYARLGITEMRPYIKGEDLTGVSVSEKDDPNTDMGMLARDPKAPDDRWYVNKAYFRKHYSQVRATLTMQEG